MTLTAHVADVQIAAITAVQQRCVVAGDRSHEAA